MSRFWMILAALCLGALSAFAQVPGSVVFTEVMYDDTAGTDVEWVEIHNTTAAPIDISGWVVVDDDVYPANGGEGAIQVPASTTIGAGAYMVLSRDATGLAGAVMCTQISSSWGLGNGGDNLALYTAATGGTLIDGALNVSYPDLAGANLGNSIEKCDPNSAWSSDAAAWHESTNIFAAAGRYRKCTPGSENSPCADAIPPTIASCSVISGTQVDVLFSETVELVSAETEGNYDVAPTVGAPVSALRDGTNLRLVHLTFAAMPNGSYTLSVNNVTDVWGNPAADQTCTFSINNAINPGDVVITEVMYDDTVSTDNEWIEILNQTNSTLDISGWVVSDDDVYPSNGGGGEGAMIVPTGTFLAAGARAILCRVDLPEITGEILCANLIGGWTLGNGGDNCALFTAASGGLLVDGSLSVFYPDLAFGNAGNSIEKCNPDAGWSGDAAEWTQTKVSWSTTGRYRHITPYTQGFCCPDPAAGTITVNTYGPDFWIYTLTHVSGCIDRVIFTNFCAGTVGQVTGEATTFWSVLPNGDGNDGDSIVFVAEQPLNEGSVTGFALQHPWCNDFVDWTAGGNSGSVEGPLPVAFNGLDIIAGDAEVVLNWSTASEIAIERFELTRDGALIANVTARNSASGANYTFTDNRVTNGETYSYELAVVSITGDRDVLATQSATPQSGNAIVTEFALHQNYPNPFNPETAIRFDLAEASEVTLTVFNVAGQEVATLVNGNMNAGAHSVSFDGANLTSGVYLYRLTAGEFTSTMKMVLLK
ncbi:MAG: lamin tail domain-containing protein [bacterium]|nr:lamin tail domain-containing protein [bacterium]